MTQKAILTCAPTGAIHTPSMSPHLPVTADEIAEAGIAAAEAGASIIHLHARDEETGRPVLARPPEDLEIPHADDGGPGVVDVVGQEEPGLDHLLSLIHI